MLLLAIDTSSHFSAVCVFDQATATVLAEDSRNIGRGHAEILMDQIKACLEETQCAFGDIQRIGVASGPGSFTGVRVGMAAAKGLGLGLDIPVVGVSCLEACEKLALRDAGGGTVLSALDANRDQVFCKFSGHDEPWIDTPDCLAKRLIEFSPTMLAGSAAASVASLAQNDIQIIHEAGSFPVSVYASIATQKTVGTGMPEPVYLRNADAKSQEGFALARQ